MPYYLLGLLLFILCRAIAISVKLARFDSWYWSLRSQLILTSSSSGMKDNQGKNRGFSTSALESKLPTLPLSADCCIFVKKLEGGKIRLLLDGQNTILEIRKHGYSTKTVVSYFRRRKVVLGHSLACLL